MLKILVSQYSRKRDKNKEVFKNDDDYYAFQVVRIPALQCDVMLIELLNTSTRNVL